MMPNAQDDSTGSHNDKDAGLIVFTLTWRGVLPLLLTGYTDGTEEGRKLALHELYRMADIADKAGPWATGLE